MQCADTKTDILEDNVNFFGKDISSHFTSSSHYAIPQNDSFEGSAYLEDSKFTEVSSP